MAKLYDPLHRSQSDVRDEVQEELDEDEPAADHPGKQIVMQIIWNWLETVGSSLTSALQDISQQLTSLYIEFCNCMAQCDSSYSPPMS